MNSHNEITVNGMILSAMSVGEADKRLVLLTRERGKIVVFANGAKRQNSPLGSLSEPFCFGQFTIRDQRGIYKLNSVRCESSFRELIEDFDKSCYGFYFLEFAEYFTMENNDETQMLNLLVLSIRALLKPSLPDKLVRYIFELKAITINGEAPWIYQCCECKETVKEGYFSFRKRGILCKNCKITEDVYLSESALYTMQYIISAELTKLYTFVVSDEVYGQIKKMMDRYRSYYIDHNFKSLTFLTE